MSLLQLGVFPAVRESMFSDLSCSLSCPCSKPDATRSSYSGSVSVRRSALSQSVMNNTGSQMIQSDCGLWPVACGLQGRRSHLGHRPGQDMGLMQWPWLRTRLAGQWQPATQGLWHGPISFQLSQVLVQPGPQVSYTAPCLHCVAAERQTKIVNNIKLC